MARIFPLLAAVNALALVAAFAVGTLSKLRDGVHHPEDPTYWIHFLTGLAAAFLTLLVHCIIFVYFLGTGRWVKEVALAYDIPDQPLPRLTRDLKRRVFPPALFAMLTVIATAMAGAAAHVGAWPWWVHASFSLVALGTNAWAYGVEYSCLRANGDVLDQVAVEVDRIRRERGLPTNAEALAEEEAERA
jgi:hypothetical protein